MDDEQSAEQPDYRSSNDEPSAQRTLESAARYVAACTAANGADHGGRSAFSASFEAIIHWGEANKIVRSQSDFAFFRRPPTGEGKEHQGWFDESSNRWYKATFENRFGLAWGRPGSATAAEYLTRLVLQNRHFGDDIQLVALAECGQKLRTITSQPHIVGDKAEYDDIRIWFRGLGFARFESNGSVAWYRKADNLLVSDAHEGNVIRSVTGALFAIDLNLMHPNDEIRAIVLSMLELL